jgi:hypothetical protein
MAVVLGTNAGFVTVAPTASPVGTATTTDAYARAVKHTAPVGAAKITEIGWWSGDASNETNFEVGLYAHDAVNDEPAARLYVSATNAKGTTAGWKTVTVDWDIVAETIYWIAIQVDDTATATKTDITDSGAPNRGTFLAASTLSNPFGAGTEGTSIPAIYAVWETDIEYVAITGTITGTSDLSGTITVISVVDIIGSITGTGSLTGTITLSTIVDLTGSITGTGSLSGSLILSSNWQTAIFAVTRRLVAVGNDCVYYEDI